MELRRMSNWPTGFGSRKNSLVLCQESCSMKSVLTIKSPSFRSLLTMRMQIAALAALIGTLTYVLQAAEPPGVGDKAPDFTLDTLDDQTVRLSEITSQGNV